MELQFINKKGDSISMRQLTKFKNLTDGAQLCLGKMLNGKRKGQILPVRKTKAGKMSMLKDASLEFMNDWYSKSIQLVKVDFNKYSGWTQAQGVTHGILSKTNINLNLETMSKTEQKTGKKAPAKKVAKKAPAKPKAAKPKAAKPKEKKIGVIASIQEFITTKPIKESALLAKLVKRFPNREEDSMAKTIKAQIGTKKQPTRMEREKGITLVITTNEKTKERSYALAK